MATRNSGRLVRPTARRVPTLTSLMPMVNTTASRTPEGMYSNNPVRNSRTRATVTAMAMLTTCPLLPEESPAAVRGGDPLIANPEVNALARFAADSPTRSPLTLSL